MSQFAKVEFSLFMWLHFCGVGHRQVLVRPFPNLPGGVALVHGSPSSPGLPMPPTSPSYWVSEWKHLKFSFLLSLWSRRHLQAPCASGGCPHRACSVGILLLLLAWEAGQPGAHQHGCCRTPTCAVVSPADFAGSCKGNRARHDRKGRGCWLQTHVSSRAGASRPAKPKYSLWYHSLLYPAAKTWRNADGRTMKKLFFLHKSLLQQYAFTDEINELPHF